MVRMDDDREPDDLDRRIERSRRRMDDARRDLMSGIREALAAQRLTARVARYSHFSEQYIRKLRDGKGVSKEEIMGTAPASAGDGKS
jgi:hypothetical protein